MLALVDTNTRVPQAANWVVVGIPALNWLATLTLVARSRVEYQSWPSYGSPDPAVFGLHFDLTIVMYLLSLAVTLSALVAFALGRLSGQSTVQSRHAVGGLLLVASYVGFMILDIAEVSTWLGD